MRWRNETNEPQGQPEAASLAASSGTSSHLAASGGSSIQTTAPGSTAVCLRVFGRQLDSQIHQARTHGEGMSAPGTKRTCQHVRARSAVEGNSDIHRTARNG